MVLCYIIWHARKKSYSIRLIYFDFVVQYDGKFKGYLTINWSTERLGENIQCGFKIKFCVTKLVKTRFRFGDHTGHTLILLSIVNSLKKKSILNGGNFYIPNSDNVHSFTSINSYSISAIYISRQEAIYIILL